MKTRNGITAKCMDYTSLKSQHTDEYKMRGCIFWLL